LTADETGEAGTLNRSNSSPWIGFHPQYPKMHANRGDFQPLNRKIGKCGKKKLRFTSFAIFPAFLFNLNSAVALAISRGCERQRVDSSVNCGI